MQCCDEQELARATREACQGKTVSVCNCLTKVNAVRLQVLDAMKR